MSEYNGPMTLPEVRQLAAQALYLRGAHYWIRRESGDWEPARWDGRAWWVIGQDRQAGGMECVTEVGDPLLVPTKPLAFAMTGLNRET